IAVWSPAAMVRLTSSRMRRSPRTTLAFSMRSSGSVIIVFDGVDLIVVQPQMMADLVDQDMGDDLGQADVAALAPFIEERAAIQEDARRHRRRTHGVSLADVDAGLQAGQLERTLDLKVAQDFFVGEVVDADDDVPGRLTEQVGQGGEGLFGQAGEVVEGGGGLIGPGLAHGQRISPAARPPAIGGDAASQIAQSGYGKRES